MSPRRLDPATIAARAAAMTTLLGALDGLAASDIHHDLRDRLAVERALTQLVELASSINDHIVGLDVYRRYVAAIAAFVDDLDP